MSDISKCTGKGCHLKESCKRYKAKDNDFRQAYFTEPPFKEGTCHMFWGESQEQILNTFKAIFK